MIYQNLEEADVMATVSKLMLCLRDEKKKKKGESERQMMKNDDGE